MRRIICMLTVLLLCMSLAAPAFAAEDGFVPSITYKPYPEIVPVEGEDGQEHIGTIRDEDGNVIGYLDTGCLLITPVADLWDEEADVPEEVRNLLQFVYDGLGDGSLVIPYEKHEENLDAAYMVVRDLFDARWTCEEHPTLLEPEGVVLDLTFDLGVVADAQIYVQTYDEASGQWEPIVKTINNGDGTVTCTFEHLCAIAFSMPLSTGAAPVEDAQQPNLMPWIILLVVAAGAAVAVVAKNKKKSAV